jgi:hypothetical protein
MVPLLTATSVGSKAWQKLFTCGREFCGTNYIPLRSILSTISWFQFASITNKHFCWRSLFSYLLHIIISAWIVRLQPPASPTMYTHTHTHTQNAHTYYTCTHRNTYPGPNQTITFNLVVFLKVRPSDHSQRLLKIHIPATLPSIRKHGGRA